MNKNQRRRANARKRRDAEARIVADHFEVKRIIRETDRAVLGGERMPNVAPMARRVRDETAAMGTLSISYIND